MIPFYVVCALWLVTLASWQVREQYNARERLEILKLFRANDLGDYAAQDRTTVVPRRRNFIQESMGKASADLLGDE